MKILTKTVTLILATILIAVWSGGVGVYYSTEGEPPRDVTSELKPPTGETTAALTTEESIVEDTTEEVAGETTSHPLDGLSAVELLRLSEELAASYTSLVRTSTTQTTISVGDGESVTQISSELRVSGGNASFCRTSGNKEERIFLAGDQLYYETQTTKLRVGGHTLAEFIDLATDPLSFGLFDEGDVVLGGDGCVLVFSSLSDEGLLQLRNSLGLPEAYDLELKGSELRLTLDGGANMVQSRLYVALGVCLDGEQQMGLILEINTSQSASGDEAAPELPPPEDYVYFTSDDALKLYELAIGKLTSFTTSHNRFEFTVRDDALVKSEKLNVSLTSKDIYAYNYRSGISIDRNFNVPGSSRMRRSITFYNFRGCYSQMDNGTVYEDTAINPENLELTLNYPFVTSFFSLEHCLGMSEVDPGERELIFELNEAACINIASNLLLHAGVTASELVLVEGVTAYTYITLDMDEEPESVGYRFSATAVVDGITYTLERTVRLTIDSTSSANVLTIYVETD